MRFKRKSKDRKMELLRQVSLFSGCTRGELGRIASAVEEVDVAEGKVVTREGDMGHECFVIAEGRAKAMINGRKVSSLEAGSFFGEMSLLDGGRRSATVTAETDMHLLVMSSRGFSTVVEDIPTVARKAMKTMAQRLRAAEKREVTH